MRSGKTCKIGAELLRPNVECLVVNGEHTEQRLFERPIRSVMPKNVLIVPQVLRQHVILHQVVLLFHFPPQLLRSLASTRTLRGRLLATASIVVPFAIPAIRNVVGVEKPPPSSQTRPVLRFHLSAMPAKKTKPPKQHKVLSPSTPLLSLLASQSQLINRSIAMRIPSTQNPKPPNRKPTSRFRNGLRRHRHTNCKFVLNLSLPTHHKKLNDGGSHLRTKRKPGQQKNHNSPRHATLRY